MVRDRLLRISALRRFSKTALYARLRQRLPMSDWHVVDDRDRMPEAESVLIDWPEQVPKPVVGLIRDYSPVPRWTKYQRFLENNAIPYEFYDIQSRNWIEHAAKLDIVMGVLSNAVNHLQEMREKFFVLQRYLGKHCFPSFEHMLLYENKTLEAYISQVLGIPYAPTHIFFRKADALAEVSALKFPLVSKTDPGSGSMGVEWVPNERRARRIISQVFSAKGRPTHVLSFHQKNRVYFQDYVPNDGYDLRITVGTDWAVGFYRKVPPGDFRASGMHIEEFRELPQEAIRLAWTINRLIRSSPLVVDMLRSRDESYSVIEFSPICQIDVPAKELSVNGIPGIYVIDQDGSSCFQPGAYWVHELSLRDFLLESYIPGVEPKAAAPAHAWRAD